MFFSVKMGKVMKVTQNRLKMNQIEYFLIQIDIKTSINRGVFDQT